ncbi:MAG: C39 family peptidase [Candidatus Spechtbacterales bacterium]|nr:C39 family peptidase [Candidatus Spechtbacterales bacterium]
MKFFKTLGILILIEVAMIGGWFLIADKPTDEILPQSPIATDTSEDKNSEKEKIEQKQEPQKQENDQEEYESPVDENVEPGDTLGTVLLEGVPFTPQAPFGNWSDPRQQDGCEEAASIMAVHWARGDSLSLAQAENLITAISDWELENHGEYRDISASDTLNWIIKGYLGHQNADVKYGITASDIIRELEKGNIIITPTNGRLLGNPYFTPPGPERHMFVIKGYDYETGEFITNDNGTKWGEGFRYSKNTLYNAIMDYPTGYHEPIQSTVKAMIIVRPS